MCDTVIINTFLESDNLMDIKLAHSLIDNRNYNREVIMAVATKEMYKAINSRNEERENLLYSFIEEL